MTENHYLVPAQLEGESTDLQINVTPADIEDAADWFVTAKEHLWQVNHWHEYCSGTNVRFLLKDAYGHSVARRARKGDHIQINMLSGAFDWVIVEAIEYDDYPDENIETFAMHLRQVNAPGATNHNAVDHYFEATCTLVIERNQMHLKADYHGRNHPSPLDGTLHTSPWLGLDEDQWKSLLKGMVTFG